MTDEQLLQFARKWGMFASGIPQITVFAHDIRRAALEEAADLCDQLWNRYGDADECADAIRALSQKDPQ